MEWLTLFVVGLALAIGFSVAAVALQPKDNPEIRGR
jgi:hypothetical protein